MPRGRSRWGSDREYGYGFWIRDLAGYDSYYAWGYGGQFVFIVRDLRLVVVTTSRPDVSRERRDHLGAIYDLVEQAVIPAISAVARPQKPPGGCSLLHGKKSRHLCHYLVMSKKRRAAPVLTAFDVQAFLDSAKVPRRVVRYARGVKVFEQGAVANNVFYVQDGGIKLSVLSTTGKEAVVAMLGPGDFFGEGCLAAQPVRMGSATAMVASSVLRIPKTEMIRMLHEQSSFSDLFITHMLGRNIRIEEDLVDQLFNSSEKRLARALLLLARYGKDDTPLSVLPKLSQETLAEMVGTTRSRVNFFMNKFRKMGFIEYNGKLKINSSLLSIVLHE